MKFKLAAVALLASVAMFCGDCNGDLLGRLTQRDGCGDCQTVSTCCDTPAPSCGGCNSSGGINISINIGTTGRLFGKRSGGCGGCDVTPSCGCEADVCGRQRGGFLKGLFSRSGNCGGCGQPADTCGCNAAPAPSCGCDSAPSCGCGGGLLEGRTSLFSRFGNKGCGCDAAPSCGCDAAPSCGCDTDPCSGGRMRGKLRGYLTGMLSSRKSCGGCGQPAASCGCDAAPSCGCDSAPNCGCNSGRSYGSRIQVRSRLQGMVSRVKSMGSYNSGCGNSGCSSCGSGGIMMPGQSSCNSCGNGTVQYNMGDAQYPTAAPAANMNPVPVPAVVPATDGAYLGSRSPRVDPSSFTFRSN